MANIKLKLLEFKNKVVTVKKGITTLELANTLKLKEKPFMGKINDKRISLNDPINESGDFKFRSDFACNCFWEESNKIAADALFKVLKTMNLATKVISKEFNDDGFILDLEVENNISEKQIPLIEGKLKKLFETFEAKGPLNPRLIKFVKVCGVSGLTLKDDSVKGNRIFGFVSGTQVEFDKKLKIIEERIARDHRRIGREMDIFYIDESIGKGLPIWLNNGVILKNTIKAYLDSLLSTTNHMLVETPVVGSTDLFKTSGHYYHYKHGMFPEMINQEQEHLILRPMSCPFHIQVYKHKQRSYKELPIRIAEYVKQYRYEASGALIGLERVRAMELVDAHIFLKEDQLKSELENMFNIITIALKKFDVVIDYIELALHDPKDKEKYHGDSKMWNKSEKLLKEFLDSKKIPYKTLKGEAAFYGPKIDIQIKTALGHNITVSTLQLDFLLPENFDLSYIDEKNVKQKPIMIHRGLIGTFERFISILLEQTKGALPFWLAPEQVVVLPVMQKQNKYAQKLFELLSAKGIRTSIDISDNRLSYKIREYQTKKVSMQIIVGEDEVKNKTISFRMFGSEKTSTMTLEKFNKHIEKLMK